MENIKEVLDFCDRFTYYNLNNIEKAIEVKHMRGCIFNILSKCDHIVENVYKRV